MERARPTEILEEKPQLAIAGASGRIGGRLQLLLSGEFNITPLQHLRPVTAVEGQKIITDFDVTNEQSVQKAIEELAKMDVLTLINSVGVLSVDNSEQERGDPNSPMYQVHVLGSRYLAQACRNFGISLIHLSTDYAFNGHKPPGEKYTEDEMPDLDISSNPTWYGCTKALSEGEVLATHPDSTVLRLSQVQSPAGGLFTATLRQLERAEPFTRANNQQASTITDETVAEVLAQIIKSQNTGGRLDQIYHIATINAYTPYEISLQLADTYGLGEKARSLITPVTLEELVASGEQKVVRPKNSVLDTSRFEEQFPGILHPVEDEISHFKNLYGKV